VLGGNGELTSFILFYGIWFRIWCHLLRFHVPFLS